MQPGLGIHPWRTLQDEHITHDHAHRFVIAKLLPIAASSTISMFFGNYSYLYLSVSFIQVSMLHHLTACSRVATASTACCVVHRLLP